MSFEPLSGQDPRRIGSFTLLGRLGAGAMGRVYLGRSAAGRLVAVKTIRAEFAEEPDFRARFAQEVTAARRVSGAFTAAVVAADAEAEMPWLATSYVAAPSLDRLVRICGPLPVPAVRWLAAGCAEALESIHEARLVHRDLKPSNVLVSLDGPRVIDFGVARAMERATLTTGRQAVGTPAFMAPEQARHDRPVGPASDVFSLGSTLVFAATGHPPYRGETVTDILVRLATERPDLTGLPGELSGLVTACLRRDPDARPHPAELAELAHVTIDDTGQELARALLPSTALTLIGEYRRDPGPPAAESDNSTFGSQTSSTGPGAPPEPAAPALLRLRRVLGRRAGRTTSVVVSIGAIAGLLVLGGVLGRSFGGTQTRQQDQPFNFGPPPGPPPVPLSGATDRPTGVPRIVLNQPIGDGNTVFVVHGTGWTPGQRITVRLTGGPVSPATPIVDKTGTFNYAINQEREFFAGPIPVGLHRVVATPFAGGARAEAAFRVRL